jgi:hypothetical protein
MMTSDEMRNLGRTLANGRTIVQQGYYGNGCWSEVYIAIVNDKGSKVSNYEAIVVTNSGNVRQTWGKSQRSLWARVRREELATLSMSR